MKALSQNPLTISTVFLSYFWVTKVLALGRSFRLLTPDRQNPVLLYFGKFLTDDSVYHPLIDTHHILHYTSY